MTKSPIPEDMMRAAYDAHLAAIGRGTAQAVRIIASAIMAERERCAAAIKDAEDQMGKKALWLRGEQAYREYPGFSINQMRELRKAIMAGREGE